MRLFGLEAKLCPCGVAVLSTLNTHFYNSYFSIQQNLTEQHLLRVIFHQKYL